MTQQFLDRAQVATAGQQVRGEGVPQRVRRRVLGQAVQPPEPPHGPLRHRRVEPPAAHADEQRAVRLAVGVLRSQAAIAARTTGSTGTIRSLPPLPVTRSIPVAPGSGASRTSSASASAMRSPQP